MWDKEQVNKLKRQIAKDIYESLSDSVSNESIYERFYKVFNRDTFFGKEDFDSYSKLADKWWEENNKENKDDFFYLPRPVFGGIIYV